MYTIIGISLVAIFLLISPSVASLFLGASPFGGFLMNWYILASALWVLLGFVLFIIGIVNNSVLVIVSVVLLVVFLTPLIIAIVEEEGAISFIKDIIDDVKESKGWQTLKKTH